MPAYHKFVRLLVIVGLCAGSSPTLAFNLNKLLGGKLPGAPSGGAPGGLPGMPGSAPGGAPGASSGGNEQAGGDKQVNSAWLDFMCGGRVDPKEFMHDASADELKELSQAVAKDFGRSIEDTQALLGAHSDGRGAIGWAGGLDFYLGAFDGEVIKRLFSNFIKQKLKRTEIAGKIRYALTEDDPLEAKDDLYDEDKLDARLAYALILGHYNKWNKKQRFTKRLLESAYDDDSQGAAYILGRRLYLGEGVPKDVNGAGDILSVAANKQNEEYESIAWEEVSKQWNIVAADPAYKDHQRFKSMFAQAAKMKAQVEKDLAKTEGTAGIQMVLRMEKLQASARDKLSKAFGFANQYAEQAEKYKDLLNQANPDQQVVDKMVSLSADLNKYVVEKIGNTAKELDPQGIKMAQSARKDIVKVAYISQAWMTKIMTGGIHGSGLSGGNFLSKIGTIAKPLGNAMDNACGLYNAMHAYTEAKEITLPEETVSISADEEKI